MAFYSDKHNIFRVNNGEGGERIAQFGRALAALNIDINSPQAKGRVERAFSTLQDRLVKELQLEGIATVGAANAWLPKCKRPLKTAYHLDRRSGILRST